MKVEIYVAESSILYEHYRTFTPMNPESPKKYQLKGWSIDNSWIHRPNPQPLLDDKGHIKTDPETGEVLTYDVNKEAIIKRFLSENPEFAEKLKQEEKEKELANQKDEEE